MTDKIHHILSSLWKNDDSVDKTYYNQALQDVQTAIDSLQEEPVNEDLEEAIDTYFKSYWGSEKEKQEWPFLKKMIIYFAKWQKEQMMAKAIDAHCFGFQGAALFSFRLPAGSYLIGSKVKVIVIKED